jgi:hypothetical protein
MTGPLAEHFTGRESGTSVTELSMPDCWSDGAEVAIPSFTLSNCLDSFESGRTLRLTHTVIHMLTNNGKSNLAR